MESLDEYLETLASAAPTPGGGSAAAIVAALAVALVAMVARITAQNTAYAAQSDETAALISDADQLRGELLTARLADERAYAAVAAAQALPRASDEQKSARTHRLQAALTEAAAAPLHAAGLAVKALQLAGRAHALGHRHLQSDVTCAGTFARAALEASATNVRINHGYLKNPGLVEAQERRLRATEQAGERAYAALAAMQASL